MRIAKGELQQRLKMNCDDYMMNHQLILCTCPDAAVAERIAYQLIEQRLAACINIIPQVKSIYRWQDAIETAQEQLLLIKTSAGCYAQLEQSIKLLHPYGAPEIIALDISNGLPAYLSWLHGSLKE